MQHAGGRQLTYAAGARRLLKRVVEHHKVDDRQIIGLQVMAFEIDGKTARWLMTLQVLSQTDCKPLATSSFQINEAAANMFENGVKVAQIVQLIFQRIGLPTPQSLNHLKVSNQTAAQLYNWNIINEALRKLDFEIDAETKNMIINGDRQHLALALRKIHELYTQEKTDELQDSLQTEQFQKNREIQAEPKFGQNTGRESLTLSRSDQPPTFQPFAKKNSETLAKLQKIRKPQTPAKTIAKTTTEGDLVETVIQQLMGCIKLTRKQAVTLLSDNNKYLAHVFVKGVRGQFVQIEELMEHWFRKMDYIVEKMTQQNDMCEFFLQVIKPSLLSKSEEIAQWGCRILSRIAHELANRQMLPLAYSWFVRQAGGLATTILALSRHPKLNQHVVSFILEFARFNVAELFTVELKKITNNDQISYIKFILLIFDPLVDSKLSAQELLSSGAIDYWVQTCLSGAQSTNETGIQMRLYCIQFLTKMWRAYPIHIEQTLDKVNDIMGFIKRGIRESSEIMRFTLLELLFNLLDEFASKRNPYASIVYKKITFLFIENHQELNVREFMLRNFSSIISKYPTIPIEIFLEPFVKQIKIRESKSYFLNIFDMEFINIVVSHKKLKVQIALELFDLLAKTKLNNYEFAPFADQAMSVLLDRFIEEDIFCEYTAKLVKISLAIFYSTFKHKKNEKVMGEQERLNAQKRAQIINFVISLVERGSSDLNQRIKEYAIHLKLEIQSKLNTTHKGIERILSMFPNIQEDLADAIDAANAKEEVQSNMTSQNSKEGFHFPKLDPKYLSKDRDQTQSQQSAQSQATHYSKISSKQEFPQKDYTKFAEEDEQKFLKDNGIGFKRKNKPKRVVIDKEVDPKVQEQLTKAKQKKEEDQRRKFEQQQKIQKKKEQLKNKIHKELQQRNLMQGVKGFEKDVAARVIFGQNQINEKLLEDEELPKQIDPAHEENRDHESIKLVLKRYYPFLRKLFNKYASAKVNKKDFFDGDSDNMAQIDLVRLCKEKNLEKNKQTIIELLRTTNDKNNKGLTMDGFFKFMETLTVYLFVKDKCSTHYPMGDYLKQLLKKIAIGENFKLEEDEDQTTRSLTEKVKYNPHVELPQNYKKIYERVYQPKRECSYPIKKALKRESFAACYEVVNELLFDIFKFHTLEEEVRFFEEARVVKKNTTLPPRPAKKQKEEVIGLLQDKQTVPLAVAKAKRTASIASRTNKPSEKNLSVDKEDNHLKPKIVNAAEKKKLQEQQSKRLKKQKEEQQFKKRQQQIKKRMEQMQDAKERQKSKQKDEKNSTKDQQQQKRKRQKQEKEKYHQQQKERLAKYQREKDQKEKEQKDKQRELRTKQEEERKEKLKVQMKKQEQKRKGENERSKKDKEQSQEKNRRKKEEDEKKKDLLKKQVLKKLQGEKEKYQIQKLYKELLKKIYLEPDIQNIFADFKEQLKSLFSYGKEYNEFKLGDTQNTLEQKGWMTICQQFNLCDGNTANSLLKQNQKEKGRAGFLQEQFLQSLLGLSVKKEIENDLQDYDKAHKSCAVKLQKYLKSLKIPRQKQSMKDYFLGLKSNLKKKEELQVVAPNGEKQTWELKEQ